MPEEPEEKLKRLHKEVRTLDNDLTREEYQAVSTQLQDAKEAIGEAVQNLEMMHGDRDG